jgi:tRNA pseudouridine55 synthase
MNRDLALRQCDVFAAAGEVIGAFALDLDGGILWRHLLDGAGVFRQQRLERGTAGPLLAGGGDLAARPVEIHRLTLVNLPDPDTAEFETECGKGTYVRSLARDIGRELECCGHIKALRRVSVGSFGENDMISLEQLTTMCHRAAAGEVSLADAILPVETALDDIPALAVSRADAARLQRGQAVLLRGRDAPIFRGTVYVTVSGQLVALAEVDRGEIVPKRVFNLSGLVGSRGLQKGH